MSSISLVKKPVSKQVVEQKKAQAASVINATHNTSGGNFDNRPEKSWKADHSVFQKSKDEKQLLKQLKKQFKSGNRVLSN